MKVLLSIKPEFADKILSGEKQYEFRKIIFKNPNIKTIVIYATMPVGKVIGEFTIDEILNGIPSQIWEDTKHASGIQESFFNEYFDKRENAYAIKVKSVKRYKKPFSLFEILGRKFPPQSFCYLS